MRKVAVQLALLLALLLSAGSSHSAEYALIVGGGNSPERNPASLERQVLQAVEVLEHRKFARLDVLFADGNASEPDIAEALPEGEKVEAEKESVAAKNLRLIYGPAFGERDVPIKLRNHRVPNVKGAATKANLNAWFAEQGSKLQAGDTLLLYLATHGTLSVEGNSEPASNQSELLLWCGGRLSVSELSALIRQLPRGVQVHLLITACYAGGFAELAWPAVSSADEANSTASQRPVAGFFATSFDRPAAGCTTGADSLNVRDYATCFWSALAGKWPDGKPVDGGADLNGDGSISLGEAHALALVNDTTLDTPLKASDHALRQISRFGRAEETRLLTDDPYYDELRAAAKPEQQNLLNQLSARMSLTGKRRLSKARMELRRLTFDLKVMAEERTATLQRMRIKQAELRLLLGRTFPELSPEAGQAEISPEKVQQFIDNRGAEFEQTALEDALNLSQLQVKLAKQDYDRLQIEERWAGYQRFVQTAESVILAHNLPLVVEDQAVLQRFESLRKAENRPLTGTR